MKLFGNRQSSERFSNECGQNEVTSRQVFRARSLTKSPRANPLMVSVDNSGVFAAVATTRFLSSQAPSQTLEPAAE